MELLRKVILKFSSLAVLCSLLVVVSFCWWFVEIEGKGVFRKGNPDRSYKSAVIDKGADIVQSIRDSCDTCEDIRRWVKKKVS